MSNEKKLGGTLFGLGEVERERLTPSPVPPAAAPVAPPPLGGTVRLGSVDSSQLQAKLEAAIRSRTEPMPLVRMPSTRAPTLMGTGPLQEPESHVPTQKGQGRPPLPETATQSLVPTLRGRGQPPLPETATQSLVPTLKGRGQPPLPETAAESLVPTLKGQGQPPPPTEASPHMPSTTMMATSEAPSAPPGTFIADKYAPVPTHTHIKTLMSSYGPSSDTAGAQLDLAEPPPAQGNTAPSAPPQLAGAIRPAPAATPSTPPQPTTYSSSPPPAVLTQWPPEPASPGKIGRAFILVPVLGLLLVLALGGVGVVGYSYYRHSVSAAGERSAIPDQESEGSAARTPSEEKKPSSNAPQATATLDPPGAELPAGSAAPPTSDRSSDTSDTSDTRDSDTSEVSGAPTLQLECTPACERMTVVVCDGERMNLVDGGLRLDPGSHACMFRAPGYAVRQYQFEVGKGEVLKKSVVLTPRPAARQSPRGGEEPETCGTFINRCGK